MKKKFRLFYSTCPGKKRAMEIAKSLIKNKSAVCVNVIKEIDSVFIDKKTITSSKESILMIKTSLPKEKIESVISEIHPYEIPFIIEINVNQPNIKYLNWFLKNTVSTF